MKRAFDELLVELCAPTLAGLKPASLFRFQAQDPEKSAACWGAKLAPFGIAVHILKTCRHTGSCLIYLCRMEQLSRLLSKPDVSLFLKNLGYLPDLGCKNMINQVLRRLCLSQDFPHEIGIFLGYPLEDVVGFIQNRGQNFTCYGCWKAYGDPVEARRRFDCYRRCTAIYVERFRQGAEITQLIVA